jgi:hypothetical protein
MNVLGKRLPLLATILGLGGLAAVASAQSTVTKSGDAVKVTGSTAGPINPHLDRAPGPPIAQPTGSISMSQLLHYKVQASDGGFGQVWDVVLDHNGRVQYLLTSYNGRIYPLPLLPSALDGAPNTLTYKVPVGMMEQLAVNPENLPSLRNRAFVVRMHQVFGPDFADRLPQPLSAYPPTDPAVSGATPNLPGEMRPSSGTGPRRPTGGSLNVGGNPGTGVAGTGIGGPGTSGTGTGRSGTGEGTTGGISGTGAGTSASGALNGAAAGGAPGSTGGTAGSAGGSPDKVGNRGGVGSSRGSGS